MRRLSATVLAEADIGFVEVEVARRQQQRHRAAAGPVAQLEKPVFQNDGPGGRQIVVAHEGAQERDEPLLDVHLSREQIVAGPTLGIACVEVVADTPVAGQLLLDRKRLREPVVGAGLARGIQRGDRLEELGREYAAFDSQSREPVASTRARHGHKLPIGRKTYKPILSIGRAGITL